MILFNPYLEVDKWIHTISEGISLKVNVLQNWNSNSLTLRLQSSTLTIMLQGLPPQLRNVQEQ